jgi:hypothetical protein
MSSAKTTNPRINARNMSPPGRGTSPTTISLITVQKRLTKKIAPTEPSKNIEQPFDAALPFSKVIIQFYRGKVARRTIAPLFPGSTRKSDRTFVPLVWVVHS